MDKEILDDEMKKEIFDKIFHKILVLTQNEFNSITNIMDSSDILSAFMVIARNYLINTILTISLPLDMPPNLLWKMIQQDIEKKINSVGKNFNSEKSQEES